MEIGVRCVAAVLVFFDWLLLPLFWWKSIKKRIVIAPVKDEILKLSATCLAEKIRNKVLLSEEVVQAYIQRIKEVNPILNAIVQERFEGALQDARNVDQYILKFNLTKEELELCKPLLGVPVTIKESCSLKGLSHCVGTRTRIGVTALSDGEAVARLKTAGAIPLLVSTTPEICLAWECSNLVTGTTCNPYNTNCTSGGSSGGEGALLGSAASVIGLGSDIAGSIRIPAMFNGVFGHKPTPGIVPIEGHYPFSSDKNFVNYLVVGPMVRYAEDLKLMMKVLAGNNASRIKLDQQVDLSKITVYYMNEPGYSLFLYPNQKDILDVMKKVVQHLKEVSHSTISSFKFKEMEDSGEISIALFFGMKDIPNLLEQSNASEVTHNLYIELIKSIFGLSEFYKDTLIFYLIQKSNLFIPRRNYQKYVKDCNVLKDIFINKLGTSGIFLYPTFPVSAFLHGSSTTKLSGTIYTMIFNILGFPSTHVPLGLDKNGMPIGLQVVAAPNQDRLCFAIALELEKYFGGWREP